jgi:hypothetical protein
MAKQIGDIKITGTYDNVTYYKMDGEYYARSKSSLTGKAGPEVEANDGVGRKAGQGLAVS